MIHVNGMHVHVFAPFPKMIQNLNKTKYQARSAFNTLYNDTNNTILGQKLNMWQQICFSLSGMPVNVVAPFPKMIQYLHKKKYQARSAFNTLYNDTNNTILGQKLNLWQRIYFSLSGMHEKVVAPFPQMIKKFQKNIRRVAHSILFTLLPIIQF